MKTMKSPYSCLVLVCTKRRNGERKSCGDSGSEPFKEILKKEISDRGWKGRVRVSDTGCLGLCESGPNILLYPQQIWFSGITRDDLPAILKRIDALLAE